MKFEELALDLLNAILSFNSVSYAFLRLWMCGNKRLQWNLAHGLEVVRLVDHRTVIENGLPQILTYLRSLRSVSIDRGGLALGDVSVIRKIVKKLPKSIEELSFVFLEAQEIFFDDFVLPSWLMDESSASYDASVPSQYGNMLWDIGLAFPALKSLELNGIPVFDPCDIASLPSTLTSIRIRCRDSSLDFSAYPRGLTRCTIGREQFQMPKPQNLSLLPPNLIDFDLRFPSSLYAGHMAFLPRTVTATGLAILKWSSEMVLASPPHLTRIQCSLPSTTEDTDSFPPLPPHLTHLTIIKEGKAIINDFLLKSLPRSLKTLFIPDINWNQVQLSHIPALTSLWVHSNNSEPLTEAIISILPSSLTLLRYVGQPCHIDIFALIAKHIPHLRSLHMSIKEETSDGNPNLNLCLLSSLRDLKFSSLVNATLYFEKYEENSRRSIILSPMSEIASLLTSLTIDSASTNLPVSQLAHLPRSLTSLELRLLLNDWEPKRQKSQINHFLPPTTYDEASIFQNLPKGLIILQVYDAIFISDPLAFKSLPSSLERLHWGTSQPHDRQMLPFLPPKLRNCFILLDTISNSDLVYLPRSLIYFGISAIDTSAITLGAIYLLPPNIVLWRSVLAPDLNLPLHYERLQRERVKHGIQ